MRKVAETAVNSDLDNSGASSAAASSRNVFDERLRRLPEIARIRVIALMASACLKSD
jgi:hypothetical protein